jgi:hypothetical protein
LDDKKNQLVSIESSPLRLSGLSKFEHHRQAGSPGSVSFVLRCLRLMVANVLSMGFVVRKCPMFGREVIEGEQRFTVFRETFAGIGVLGCVLSKCLSVSNSPYEGIQCQGRKWE